MHGSTTQKYSRIRWYIGLSLALACLALLLWGESITHAQQPPDPSPNLDIILLIDSSDKTETLRAAQFLLDYLRASEEAQHATYRVGLANFGEKVGETFNLQLLQDDTLRNALRPEQIKGTEFIEPLKFAVNQFDAKSDPQMRKVILLVTDGQVEQNGQVLQGKELQDHFSQVTGQIASMADRQIELFVLAIGDAQKYRANWEELIGPAHYIPLGSTTDLNNTFHDIVGQLLGLSANPGQSSTQGQFFPVDPLVENVTISFLKSSPAITLTLRDPHDNPVAPTISGDNTSLYQIYSLPNPVDGKWHIEYKGQGPFQYWIKQRYSALQVALAAPFPYSTQPISISSQLVRGGVPVTQTANLQVDAEVVAPGRAGVIVPLALPVDGSSLYTGVFTDTRASGMYTVTARARLSNGQTLQTRQVPASIALLSLPSLPSRVSTALLALILVVTSLVVGIVFLGRQLWQTKKIVADNERQQADQSSDKVREVKNSVADAKKEATKVEQGGGSVNKALAIIVHGCEIGVEVIEEVKEPLRNLLQLLEQVVANLSKPNKKLVLYDTGHENNEDDPNNIITALKLRISQNEEELVRVLNMIQDQSPSGLESVKSNLDAIVKNRIDWLDKLPSDIGADSKRVYDFEDICSKLLEVIKHIDDPTVLSYNLQMVSQSYKEADSSSGESFFYKYLERLAEYPLHPVVLPDKVVDEFWEKLSRSSQTDVKKLIHDAFRLDSPLKTGNMRKRIQNLRDKMEDLRELDRAFLTAICQKWEDLLIKIDQQEKGTQVDGQVVLSLAPDLSLTPVSESREKELVFLIENLSAQPIWNIRLLVNTAVVGGMPIEIPETTDGSKVKSLSKQKASDSAARGSPNKQVWNYEVTLTSRHEIDYRIQAQEGYLYAGQWHSFPLKIKVTKAGLIDISVRYSTYDGDRLTPLVSGFCQVLPVNEPKQSGKTQPLENPFIPERPIRHIDELSRFENVESRRKTLSEILEILQHDKQESRSSCVNIHGLHLTGKTTLLRYLLKRLQSKADGDSFFPVRIDCNIVISSSELDVQSVLTSIAKLIRNRVQEVWPEFEHYLTEDLSAIDELHTMSEWVRQNNESIVIILDDLDVFYGFNNSEGNLFDHILDNLLLLNTSAAYLGLVFSTTYVVSKNKPDRDVIIDVPLKFLERVDVAAVASLAHSLIFSGQALEFLYRVTGGYPYLVQRILYDVFEDRMVNGKIYVTVSIIKGVLRKMLATKKRDYVNILKIDLTDDEQHTINSWARNLNIDSISMHINLKDGAIALQEYIDGLQQKDVIAILKITDNIIERTIELYKLRVGYLFVINELTRVMERSTEQLTDDEIVPV